MKILFKILAVLAASGAIVGCSVVGLGLYNVSARAGHVPGVEWVLHTTYMQSVRRQAPDAAAVPADLDDPDRVRLGEMHFQAACVFCHAVPGQERSATAQAMVPPPPHITEAVADWQPQHLFWIVREGVKLSGMPHWPAEGRDDEIWSMVAYLDSVQAQGQETQEASIGQEQTAGTCIACHGERGQSSNRFVPRLDILLPDQISAALQQYRDGARPSGFMAQQARNLTDTQIAELGERFGASDLPAIAEPSAKETGFALASRGSDDVPACTACHGPGRQADAPIAPWLAGQSMRYLQTQLFLWRDGHRGGGPRAHIMRKAAARLNDAEIEALAAWFSGLQAEPTRTQ